MKRILAVARRVLRQLASDRRFLILSIAAPLITIFITRAAFSSMNVGFFDASRFAVPVGAFVVHFITYVLCAIVLVRERTLHTLSRMFVNGYRQADIVGGYLAAYTCLATLQSLLVLTELSWLFRLNYSLATLFSIYVVIWLLAVISICLGIFVSNFARTEGQVFPFIPMVTVPGILLSGLVIPVKRLPEWAQWLSHATPLFYATEVIERLIRPGGTLGDNWQRLAALVAYGAVVLLLATRTLREAD